MTLQVEEQHTKNMKIVNDLGCSWINDLDKRSNIKTRLFYGRLRAKSEI